MKTATVRARIEPELKLEVEQVFNELGLSFSQAIELFLTQVKLNHGLPYEIRIPKTLTLKTFEETDNKKNLIHHKSVKAMFDKLGM